MNHRKPIFKQPDPTLYDIIEPVIYGILWFITAAFSGIMSWVLTAVDTSDLYSVDIGFHVFLVIVLLSSCIYSSVKSSRCVLEAIKIINRIPYDRIRF